MNKHFDPLEYYQPTKATSGRFWREVSEEFETYRCAVEDGCWLFTMNRGCPIADIVAEIKIPFLGREIVEQVARANGVLPPKLEVTS